MVDIQSATAEIRRGRKKRKKKKKKKPQGKNIMSASATQGGHNYYVTESEMKLKLVCPELNDNWKLNIFSEVM